MQFKSIALCNRNLVLLWKNRKVGNFIFDYIENFGTVSHLVRLSIWDGIWHNWANGAQTSFLFAPRLLTWRRNFLNRYCGRIHTVTEKTQRRLKYLTNRTVCRLGTPPSERFPGVNPGNDCNPTYCGHTYYLINPPLREMKTVNVKNRYK